MLHLDTAMRVPVTCSSRVDKLLVYFNLTITAQVGLARDIADALPFVFGGDAASRTDVEGAVESPGDVGHFRVGDLRFRRHCCLVVVGTSAAARIIDCDIDVHVDVEVDLGLDPLRICVAL